MGCALNLSPISRISATTPSVKYPLKGREMASYNFSVKSGKRGKASEHAAYIVREGKHRRGEKSRDLTAKNHGNLPVWANNDPAYFWKMADKNERVNGSTYIEYEIALPSELTQEQNLQLVRAFVEREVGTKTYQFAIHSPEAAIGRVSQPHAHVMVNNRVPDGIDRSPEQHFKRFNSKDPNLGGCKKDSGGLHRGEMREQLIAKRAAFADLQNQYLAKHGHDVRVDHRSNKERGLEREPEQHLGQSGIKKLKDEDRQRIRQDRLAAD